MSPTATVSHLYLCFFLCVSFSKQEQSRRKNLSATPFSRRSRPCRRRRRPWRSTMRRRRNFSPTNCQGNSCKWVSGTRWENTHFWLTGWNCFHWAQRRITSVWTCTLFDELFDMAVVQRCFLNAHLCKVSGCSIVKRVHLELAAVCVCVCVCVFISTHTTYVCVCSH